MLSLPVSSDEEGDEMSEILPPLVFKIASLLDHPSAFMGGPSHDSRRRARAIVALLEEEGVLSDSGSRLQAETGTGSGRSPAERPA